MTSRDADGMAIRTVSAWGSLGRRSERISSAYNSIAVQAKIPFGCVVIEETDDFHAGLGVLTEYPCGEVPRFARTVDEDSGFPFSCRAVPSLTRTSD